MIASAKDTQAFLDGVKDIDKVFTKNFMAQFDGVQLGFTELPDDMFRFWFEKNVSQNPNWLAAGVGIPDPDFGKDVRRYMRITGVKGDGLDWRAFALMMALRYSRGKEAMASFAQNMMGGGNGGPA